MKKLIAVLAFAFAVTGAGAQNDGTKVAVGDNVPQFTVTMTDGSTVNIADLKGKVVLINFWATWCPPCRSELARVQKEIVDRFADADFVFLPISRGEEKKVVVDFLAQNGYKWNSGIDPQTAVFPLFAENSIPRNFIIGRDGKIAAAEIGYSPDLFTELTHKIENTLKNK